MTPLRAIRIGSMALVVLLGLEGQAPAEELRQVRLGVVLDGPTTRDDPIAATYRREILALLEGEFEVTDRVVEGDWTPAGVEAALAEMLEDPEIDIVIAAGTQASLQAATAGPLPKPVIAPYVLDVQVQGIPIKNGSSGVENLVYVAYPPTFVTDVRVFRDLVAFDRLVIVHRPGPTRAESIADVRLAELGNELGVRFERMAAKGSVAETLATLPEHTRAVYLSPLYHFTEDDMKELAQGLIERKVAGFSGFSVRDVELGILATNSPDADVGRLARRVAIDIQRILLGDEPASIPVTFSRREQLTINMKTAREIGVYPPFALMTDAQLLEEERVEATRTLSLPLIVERAMTLNLDLQVAEQLVEAARQDVRSARSVLLPQLSLSARQTLIDQDRGSILQPERRLSASLGLTQLIYSDDAWTGYEVQKQAYRSSEEQLREFRLDLTQVAATAYLNVLQAKTLERISKENLQLTRRNLDRARVREQIGMASSAEVYRWESELASNRLEVIEANTTRNIVELEVNRLLDQPLEEPFLTSEADLEDPSLITSDERIHGYLDDQWSFRRFRAFNVKEAYASSPELLALDATIAAQNRILLGTKRAFYVPDLALQAQVDKHLVDGGAGSEQPSPFDDWDWQVGFQASLPLFQGRARSADRARASVDLERLLTERASVAQRIEQRVRASLHRIGASNAGIALTRQGADAAAKNLELVTDAYTRGVVSIIDLLDAQNAAFVSEFSAVNANYEFLLDLMEVERAVGRFTFFSAPPEREAYFKRLETYFAAGRREDR